MIALSFLGVSNYQETTYHDQVLNKSFKSRYFTSALSHIYNPDKLFVVMTSEAEEKHYTLLCQECNFNSVKIPKGKSVDEIWEMFEIICNNIPPESELIIDVTHGFRTQPMLALSMAIFLRVVRNVKIYKIIYGAFEAKNEENITPIFDITSFINLIDWTFATQDFVRNGNVKELRSTLDAIHKKSYVTRGSFKATELKNLGKNLDEITTAFSVVRPLEVLQKIMALPQHIEQVQRDISNIPEVKPLGELLKIIPNAFSSLSEAGGELFTNQGFIAQSEMIKYYLQINNYQQAITLARESIVSSWCVNKQLLPPDEKEQRDVAEKQLYELSISFRNGSTLEDTSLKYADIWNSIGGIRNDINHAGMRKNAKPSYSVICQIKKISEKVIKLLQYAHKS